MISHKLKKGVFIAILAPFLFLGLFFPLKTIAPLGTAVSLQKEEINNLSQASNRDKVTTILQSRKELILSQVRQNPKIIKELALSDEFKKSLTPEQKSLTEDPVKLSGTIKSYMADGGSEKEYVNLEVGKENLEVYFITKNRTLISAPATVTGLRLDNVLVVDDATQNVTYQSDVLPDVAGAQSVLVILHNFSNATLDPAFTKTAVGAEFTTNSDSTNNFYIENSYSKISLNTTVTNILTSSYDINLGCDYAHIQTDARAAATAAGYSLASYQRIVYLFPRISACGWAGLGQVGGTPSVVWINGYNDSALFAHELGHNFGSGHADTLDCGTKQVDAYTYSYNSGTGLYSIPTATCSWSEYGDGYDVMGGSWKNYHMHAAFKEIAGWVSTAETPTVTTSQTVTINPLENSASAIKAIRIQKANSSEYYWIEYKKPIGFDATLGTGVTGGATVSVFSDNLLDTLLLDMTPANNWSDIALTDGATFTDTLNDLTITQTTHSDSSVTLNITFNASTPVTPVEAPATLMPVYRFYNVNGTHFYTASEAEKNNVIAKWPTKYHYEGIAYYLNTSNSANSAPLYRLWNNNGTHFYTASYSEALNAITRWPTIFKLEGVAYNVSLTGGTSVYRFYNVNGTHFYTASEAEKNTIIQKYPTKYKYEGIGFYLAP